MKKPVYFLLACALLIGLALIGQQGQPPGSSGGGVWGSITGTLSSQTDLQTALNGKQASLGFTAENSANKDANSGYAGLNSSGQLKISTECPTATSSVTGCLASADWSTFNGKQAALGFTPLNPANNLSEVTAATARSNIGAAASNATMTVNGTSCALGGTCSPSAGANISSGTYASLPATCTHTSTQSDIYLFSNSQYDKAVCTAANTWTLLMGGAQVSDPNAQTWSWLNQTSASTDTTRGGLFIQGTANSGVNIQAQTITAPSTPYTISVAMIPYLVDANNNKAGIFFKKSTDNKLVGFVVKRENNENFFNETFTSVNGHNGETNIGSASTFGVRSIVYLCVGDDGTNLTNSWSSDGIHWVQKNTQTETNWLVAKPDLVGFGFDSDGSNFAGGVWLLSWKIGTACGI